MAKVKVKVKKGKSGTIVARAVVRANKNARAAGEPVFQTKAQLNIHLDGRGTKTEFKGTD